MDLDILGSRICRYAMTGLFEELSSLKREGLDAQLAAEEGVDAADIVILNEILDYWSRTVNNLFGKETSGLVNHFFANEFGKGKVLRSTNDLIGWSYLCATFPLTDDLLAIFVDRYSSKLWRQLSAVFSLKKAQMQAAEKIWIEQSAMYGNPGYKFTAIGEWSQTEPDRWERTIDLDLPQIKGPITVAFRVEFHGDTVTWFGLTATGAVPVAAKDSLPPNFESRIVGESQLSLAS